MCTVPVHVCQVGLLDWGRGFGLINLQAVTKPVMMVLVVMVLVVMVMDVHSGGGGGGGG